MLFVVHSYITVLFSTICSPTVDACQWHQHVAVQNGFAWHSVSVPQQISVYPDVFKIYTSVQYKCVQWKSFLLRETDSTGLYSLHMHSMLRLTMNHLTKLAHLPSAVWLYWLDALWWWLKNTVGYAELSASVMPGVYFPQTYIQTCVFSKVTSSLMLLVCL